MILQARGSSDSASIAREALWRKSIPPLPLCITNALRYAAVVIASFHDAGTRELWETGKCRKLATDLHRKALKKLYILHAALALENLSVPPGNRLEKLKGGRSGQHSIRINDRTAYASSGAAAMHTRSKLSTTTEGARI
jgi:proteic killer suppression protein